MTDDELRAALLSLAAAMAEDIASVAQVLPANVRAVRASGSALVASRLREVTLDMGRTHQRATALLAALEGH